MKRTAVGALRALAWCAFVPPFVVFGLAAAACLGMAILTRAVPAS